MFDMRCAIVGARQLVIAPSGGILRSGIGGLRFRRNGSARGGGGGGANRRLEKPDNRAIAGRISLSLRLIRRGMRDSEDSPKRFPCQGH